MEDGKDMAEQITDNIALIGGRIREDRKHKGLTLLEVAEMAGLSVSYLSQIENGKVNINISILEAISKALGTTMASYFLDAANPEVSLVRKMERRWYGLGNNAIESLLIKSRGNLEVAVIHIEPHGNTGHPSSHQGEEFSYVSRGSVRMILNDRESFDLNEGDVIYYQSDVSHKWENIGDITAEVLIINTPATY